MKGDPGVRLGPEPHRPPEGPDEFRPGIGVMTGIGFIHPEVNPVGPDNLGPGDGGGKEVGVAKGNVGGGDPGPGVFSRDFHFRVGQAGAADFS